MNVSEEILEDILNNSVTVDETLQSVEYVVEGLMIGVVGNVRECFRSKSRAPCRRRQTRRRGAASGGSVSRR